MGAHKKRQAERDGKAKKKEKANKEKSAKAAKKEKAAKKKAAEKAKKAKAAKAKEQKDKASKAAAAKKEASSKAAKAAAHEKNTKLAKERKGKNTCVLKAYEHNNYRGKVLSTHHVCPSEHSFHLPKTGRRRGYQASS